jgi:hypothetical protein
MRTDLYGEFAVLRFELRQRDQCVLDVLGGLQHRLAIGGQRFGIGALGLRDLRIDPAEIEQPPAQPSRRRRLEGLRGEQLAGGQAFESAMPIAKPSGSTPPWPRQCAHSTPPSLRSAAMTSGRRSSRFAGPCAKATCGTACVSCFESRNSAA